LRNTKYICLLFSIFICIGIGFCIHIWSITADEYSKFDRSIDAANKALFLENINRFYLPFMLGLHLIIFLTFKFRDAKV
jgi:hypothetical protein